MKPLGPPDSYYFSAACGWLELGLPQEAERELQLLPPAQRRHPQVLRLEWRLAARRKQWNRCAEVAHSLTQIAPDDRFGWVHLAYSLHQLGRTAQARELLFQALDMFEPNATMALYLSCFACCLGHAEESQEWLARAFELAPQPQDRERLKESALTEPALAPLRDVIQHLA